MSITDATTNLDTSYTEQSVVAFTAGTLATINSCITEVEAKIKRGTLSTSTTPTLAQVQTWLIRAKQELAEAKNFSFSRRYASLTTVANQYRYSMPPDYRGGHTVLRDTSNDRQIVIWDTHWFNTQYPDPSKEGSNEPLVACIKGMELILVPPPDSTYTIELEYNRSGDDNTETDFSWLPQIERFRCCDFATAESFEALHQWKAASFYRQKWESGLNKSIRADGKKRWKSMKFQAISHFQEYAAQNYQSENDN